MYSPAISSSDFTTDNTKVYANVETSLNVRSGPGTSYESLTTIPSGTKMTRIAKGKQKGELWDRVKLESGLVGYVFQTYVEEVPNVQVEKITLSLDKTTINKGERIKIKANISPEDAVDKTLKYSSDNTSVATVSSDGYIQGISSGSAKITAKASNGVTGTINIKVYSPVTDIITSTDNIVLQIGETYKINATVIPDDADNKNILYNSENSGIAKVDEQGIVTGETEGETSINAVSGEGTISKKIKVKVIPQIQEGEIIIDESLYVEGNEISGLENKNNTADKILNKIKTNYSVEIYNSKGSKISGNELVGTGSVIKVLNNKDLVMEYNVIMYGDVNGDGKINSVDLLVLQRHILEIEKFSGVFLKAGNIRKNGRNPSSVDLLLIQRHILGLQNIVQ